MHSDIRIDLKQKPVLPFDRIDPIFLNQAKLTPKYETELDQTPEEFPLNHPVQKDIETVPVKVVHTHTHSSKSNVSVYISPNIDNKQVGVTLGRMGQRTLRTYDFDINQDSLDQKQPRITSAATVGRMRGKVPRKRFVNGVGRIVVPELMKQESANQLNQLQSRAFTSSLVSSNKHHTITQSQRPIKRGQNYNQNLPQEVNQFIHHKKKMTLDSDTMNIQSPNRAQITFDTSKPYQSEPFRTLEVGNCDQPDGEQIYLPCIIRSVGSSLQQQEPQKEEQQIINQILINTKSPNETSNQSNQAESNSKQQVEGLHNSSTYIHSRVSSVFLSKRFKQSDKPIQDFIFESQAKDKLMAKYENLPKIDFKNLPASLHVFDPESSSDHKGEDQQTEQNQKLDKVNFIRFLRQSDPKKLIGIAANYQPTQAGHMTMQTTSNKSLKGGDEDSKKIIQSDQISLHQVNSGQSVRSVTFNNLASFKHKLIQKLKFRQHQPAADSPVDLKDDQIQSQEDSVYQFGVDPASQPVSLQRYHPEVENSQMAYFSKGNIYSESHNPALARYLSQLKENIKTSDIRVELMKQESKKVLNMMKASKAIYIGNIVKCEEQGHAKGIKKRLDPTYKYRLQQKIQKHEQVQADRMAAIKAQKKKKDCMRAAKSLERMKERLRLIEQNQPFFSGQPNTRIFRSLSKPDISMNLEDNQRKSLRKSSVNERDTEISPLGRKTKKYSLGSPQMDEDRRLGSRDSVRAKLEIRTNNSKNSILRGRQTMEIAQMFSAGSYNLTQQTTNNKRISWLLDQLGLKQALEEQNEQLVEILSVKNQTTKKYAYLNRLIRVMGNSDFTPFKQITGKQVSLGGASNLSSKSVNIFSAVSQIGIGGMEPVQSFFQSLSEEEVSLKNNRQENSQKQNQDNQKSRFQFNQQFPFKLKRQALKEYLQDRYSESIGDKIIMFVENQFQSLFRIDFRGFCTVIMDLINAGPEFFKKLAFACYSLQNQGRICEHDIFAIIEQFRQEDSCQFFAKIFAKQEVNRDTKDQKDESDNIFFEAFLQDIKSISKALMFRQILLRIQDTDRAVKDVENFRVEEFEKETDWEEHVVNYIDYSIGLITKKTGQLYHKEIIDMILDNEDLNSLLADLTKFIVSNKIALLNNNVDTQQIQDSQQSQQQVFQGILSFFKPTKKPIPCLGTGCIQRTGKKVTECSFLDFEDFQKLVAFKSNWVPSLIEDLIDQLTLGQISCMMIEEHLGQIRTQPNAVGYSSPKPIQEFLEERNIKKYGNKRGNLSHGMITKKLNEIKNDQPERIHVITSPFSVQDHISQYEFQGKFLIRKVAVKKAQRGTKGEGSPDMRQISPTRDNDFEKSEMSVIGGESVTDMASDVEGIGIHTKTQMVHVDVDKIKGLAEMRSFFGDPNFFKLFRAFYKLGYIPDDAQNNPLTVVLNLKSVTTNFSKVFNRDNKEVATRFFNLFKFPASRKGIQTIDFPRFLTVLKELHDENPKQTKSKNIAFQFFDFDENLSIGSMDILTLVRSFDEEEMELVIKAYKQISVRLGMESQIKQMRDKFFRNSQKVVPTDLSSLHKVFTTLFQPQKISESRLHAATVTGKAEVMNRIDGDQEWREASEYSGSDSERGGQVGKMMVMNEQEEKAIQGDLFKAFMMEAWAIRDYFVKEAVAINHPRSRELVNPKHNFLDYKEYDRQFLKLLKSRFGMEGATITRFINSTLFYQTEFGKNCDLYYGLDEKERESVSEEVVEMEKVLDSLSRLPRVFVQMSD